jgi:hypothetical protein
VRTYLSSYRRRRRLAWIGAGLTVAVAIGVLIALIPSPRPKRAEEELQPGAPQVYKPPKPVRLTPRIRRQLDSTIDEFVRTAVLRRDLERSWELASPALRIGVTRRQWLSGDLPVYPFAADPAKTEWDLDYADQEEVALNVTLVPRHGAEDAAEVFGVSLSPVGRGARRHWLIGSWYPRGEISQPPPPAPPAAASKRPTPEQREAIRRATEGQIDRIWWLVPAGVLALIVVGPLAYFGVLRLRRTLRRPAA